MIHSFNQSMKKYGWAILIAILLFFVFRMQNTSIKLGSPFLVSSNRSDKISPDGKNEPLFKSMQNDVIQKKSESIEEASLQLLDVVKAIKSEQTAFEAHHGNSKDTYALAKSVVTLSSYVVDQSTAEKAIESLKKCVKRENLNATLRGVCASRVFLIAKKYSIPMEEFYKSLDEETIRTLSAFKTPSP